MSKGNNNTKKQKSETDLSNEDAAYAAIFEGDFGSLDIGTYIDSDKKEGATQHLPDAVDFEDEDELAEEELTEESFSNNNEVIMHNQVSMKGLPLGKEGTMEFSTNDNALDIGEAYFDGPGNEEYYNVLPQDNNSIMERNISVDEYQGGNNALFMEDNRNAVYMDHQQQYTPVFEDEYRPEIEEQTKQQAAGISVKEEKQLLKNYFPDYEKGKILKWNKLIYRKLGKYNWQRETLLKDREIRPLIPLNLKIQVQPDQRRTFKNFSDSLHTNITNNPLSNNNNINKGREKGIIKATMQQLLVSEKKTDKTDKNHYTLSEELLIATDEWDQEKFINGNELPNAKENSSENAVYRKLDGWEWNEEDLVNAVLPMAKVAQLDMNDEKLLLVGDTKNDNQKQEIPLPLSDKALLEKFNISNDEQYSILKKKHQTRVRATISNLNIEHSLPAIKLQTPYYKVSIPRDELRHFHRPNFGSKIRPGTNIVFSKLKNRKRKRDKGKDIKDSFALSQDLTIGDSAPIYLMEYSEERPLALSKFGMTSKLINYYRKTDEQDTTRPKLQVGETHVLGVQDKSPFWNFGFVEPGHIVPTLYNNMIRAPVFKHEVSGTDFLLIKSSGCGAGNRFFLRGINHLFTVGQTFPVDEIPGPNSRKVTSMRMTRMKMIVYRILNKTPKRAISLDPIARHFPDQDYGQNRQKVKEFMKYQREGPEKGLWKLKEGEPMLDNINARKLITPEQVAEVESLNQDIAFKEDNELFNLDEKLVKLEENLLSWNISKNFVNATQMRAMVQINGIGDPTGCNEGFSFLKTSMKGGFLKNRTKNDTNTASSSSLASGHTYNVAQQQKIYTEEIRKKWYIAAKSLSISNPFEEMTDPDEVNATNKHVRNVREDKKVLRIIRKERDENGIIQRKTIVIKDPRVIKGYLKGKELRSQTKIDVNSILKEEIDVNNIEGIELQKKLLQNELANLEKSQHRRRALKQKSIENKENGLEGGAKGRNRRRRCTTCGQLGHIRTNKSCPMYNGIDAVMNPSQQPNPTTSTTNIPAINEQ
ncbi:hypothetical protein TPHA_0L02240 [Tetrapisispora phaffii CBS 4417]|uniref:Transcription initiation factor TFIID subunit 1 histone acetyltransferase domain-containing protein n=1 Tax=Tetrapisispora phaffii (strain ATCC 24235 / CBS 4417 / NBRC 1672 / NRRL Y-8282 / UCD 70-5) TaxID=1071381 RepID=G8C097_TETPH|nr:hypothetical protein TPHA_0L02240 [Tetrapisispora phaffii CBS 4417]CCE65575.1 hypothetical protein TPHA_0L02240 [Tetrapisispora phaffii CBS 4417]